MLQVCFVIPFATLQGEYELVSPIGNLVLPTTAGPEISRAWPITTDEYVSYPVSVGVDLLYRGIPFPLTGNPLYIKDSPASVLPGASSSTALFLVPIADNDWLVVSRYRVWRVTNGSKAWEHEIVAIGGTPHCISAVAIRGGQYFLYVRERHNDAYDPGRIYYSAVDITGATPPGLCTTWPWVQADNDPDNFDSYGVYGYEAILTTLPDFELAVIGRPFTSSDGPTVDFRAVLTGPAIDTPTGKEASGFCSDYSFPPEGGMLKFLSPFTLRCTVNSSGVIRDSVVSYSPPTYTESQVSAMLPPGTVPEMSGAGAFLFAGEPPAVPPFWTSLRRAIEVI